MMDLVREWLVGITAAAIIGAAAEWITPEGTVKKVGKLAAGLLLMIAVLKPIIGLDFETLSGALASYRLESDGYSEQLEEENLRLLKAIIEEQTAAYIQDKAGELGIECLVEVACGLDSDGNQIPKSIMIRGDLLPEQQTALGRVIEGELALGKEHQRYERTNTS